MVGGFVYLTAFRPLDNDDITAQAWKGGGCGLPDVLDFRDNRMRLHGYALYMGDTRKGRIGMRENRFSADAIIEVLAETGETCPYWNKWRN